jgi:hypothetical protein
MRRAGIWRFRSELALVAIALSVTAGCDSVIGIGDVPPVTDATADTSVPTEAGPPDAPGDAVADAGSDATADGPPSCGDTLSSAVNCGSCGHACLGAACVMGACQAVPLLAVGSGPSPLGLAQDQSYLYWTDNAFNSVMRTDKVLGGYLMIGGGGHSPSAIVASGGSLYWGNNDNVSTCKLSGCAASTSVITRTAEAGVVSVAVDSDWVYWSEGKEALLRARYGASPDGGHDAGQDAAEEAGQEAGQDAAPDATKDADPDADQDATQDGGQDASLEAGQDAAQDASQDAGPGAGQDAGHDAAPDASHGGGQPSNGAFWQGDASVGHVAADGHRVYVTGSDGLLRAIDVDSGTEIDLGSATSGGSFDVALDDAGVYWSVSQTGQGVIEQSPLSTLSATALASGQISPASIASDGTNLYWIAGTAKANETAVMACAIAACTPRVLTTIAASSLSAIVVDDVAVYVAQPGLTSGGGIWKVAK